ncbi:class I tRNA ligase family protein [Candidatus Shikimatogenerans bostrichidophilus]|uniref:class I tRNA ligase family protein n=1 Tax=Candidatus Shikimatogenerans bostrichidophilus TaxID=2943807 RepID=UPI002966191D
MDKNNYKSVIKVFIKLYEKGIIYKKKKLVNWDTYAKTTISDEEIIYKKIKKNLYYIKYFTEDKKKYLVIATTRPETIFGDTAVCINPKDKRYKKIINYKLIVPIVNRVIPIITDKSVDKKFGTGCIKITPAHSKEDYKIYKKHKINIINILNDDGTLNEKGKYLKGKDRFYVRKKVYKKLKKLGYLVKKEKIISKIAYSDRSNTIIENKLSYQWFLKMKNLIKQILKIIKEIKFYPKNKYNNLCYKWINNIKDWNISRQLKWGHRIPVYYYKKDLVVAKNLNNAIKKLKIKYNKINIKNIKQDKDVLDTWFSSCILPISVLYGINKPNNIEFNYYFPIEILVTGNDILFFWVIRMIILTSYLIKKKPFKKVYLTGIARDNNKIKISKSLGNYKNLYVLLNKYGADGIRTGILNTNYEYDFIYNENLCIKGRNFINKIWNAFKLIKKIKLNKNNKNNNKTKKINKIMVKWFKNILYYKIYKLNYYLDNYKIYKSYIIINNLFKKKFCSIYLEYIKKQKKDKYLIKRTLKYFYILLKILHPYAPFITEYICKLLNKKKNITISSWPKPKIKNINKKTIKKINYTLNFIKYLKNIKFKYSKNNNVIYIYKRDKNNFKKNIYIQLIYKFTLIKKIKIKIKLKNKNKYLLLIYKNIKFFLLKNKIIIKKNNENKKIKFYKKYLLNINNKLKNKYFLLKAPKNIINLENKKKKDIEKLIKNLKNKK